MARLAKSVKGSNLTCPNEEEDREAEEKVTWISSILDLDFLNSEKVSQHFLRWRGSP